MNRPKRIRYWVLGIALVIVPVALVGTGNISREPEFILQVGGAVIEDDQPLYRPFPPGFWLRNYRFNRSYKTVLRAMKTDLEPRGWEAVETNAREGMSPPMNGITFVRGDEYFAILDRHDLPPGTAMVEQCYKVSWLDQQLNALRQRLGM